MRVFVLYGKNGLESGRALGDELSRWLSSSGYSVKKGMIKRLEKLHKRGEEFDYIVNVGWYKPVAVPSKCLIINVPEGISASSNKKKARIRFKQAQVPAPNLWLRSADVPDSELPVVGRTTHHMKGRGFWFCETRKQVRDAEVAGATHFLKFIKNTREFRVHVMAPKATLAGLKTTDYKVIKLSEKVPGKEGKRSAIIKNHESGWFFGYPKNKKDPVLRPVRDAARLAINKLGLHWGAVDVMVAEGKPYVLEINSTPCLTDDTADTLNRYVVSIGRILGTILKPTEKIKPTVNSSLASFLKRNRF